ncbi:MAG: hypothetical protein M3Q03_11565 [Chloroflexota bacterium]|nr:hypothetical protein [Chloroflexota bacterium]
MSIVIACWWGARSRPPQCRSRLEKGVVAIDNDHEDVVTVRAGVRDVTVEGSDPRGPNRVEIALGRGLEWAIQCWVATGGRRVAPDAAPWLVGPIGAERIGATFYAAYAAEAGLEADREAPVAGLLPNFGMLGSSGFDPAGVDREIRDFYERTSDYHLDVWSQWSGALRFFARTLIYLVSRNIQQLNLPMSPLATSAGMSSEVIPLRERRTGEVVFTSWLRRAAATGEVVYAGFYTASHPEHYDGVCVKVVFPLPGGSATVLLRPEAQQDGSLKLISAGTRFGDPGYYRVHRIRDGKLRVRYLPLKEAIHVFRDAAGTLRTHHTFAF